MADYLVNISALNALSPIRDKQCISICDALFGVYTGGPGGDDVTLTVFDVIGRRVRRLIDTVVKRGWHTAPWDGTNDDGRPVTAGAYYCRLRSHGFEKAIILQLTP